VPQSSRGGAIRGKIVGFFSKIGQWKLKGWQIRVVVRRVAKSVFLPFECLAGGIFGQILQILPHDTIAP
jgi:hypothetical protein